MSIKLDVNCSLCGIPIKISPQHFGNPICYECRKNPNRSKSKLANAIKESAPQYSKKIEFKIDTPEQILRAVKAQGEVFASKGGVDLMITEFVENSFDAIKARKIQQTLPKALKQMNFTSEFENIAIEKYRMPIFEFKEKHMNLTKEEEENLENLRKKILEIIKSEKAQKEFVIVELDDDKEQVRIIDSGTGIEHPIHICQKPFISPKTGEDHSVITGKFGRGSQVFREFCELMEFYSLRERLSNREQENIIADGVDTTKIDVRSIHLAFPENYHGGIYSFKGVHEYKKLSNNVGTGTIVILSGWKEDYYNELSRHLSKLERRLQHHFGFGLDDIFNIGLKIRYGKKEIEVIRKDYDNHPKIQDLFALKPIALRTQDGKPCGQIEFHIYKTNRSYDDTYKKPFLVIRGRPLGDSSISEIPGLSQVKDIWESSFVTGCVVCDSVEPNQIRVGLANNEARLPFIQAMSAASIDLKRLNTEWKNILSTARDIELTNEVIQTVSSFLFKKGIKFNFKNPLQKGIQKDLQKSGDEITNERVSKEEGVPNEGLIDAKDGEEVLIGYRKTKTQKQGGEWDEDAIIVPHGGKKKDGNTVITVKVKRSLVSKGGRRVRKSYSGPDLDFSKDEDCEDELSYFEADPPTVWVQSEHVAWKRLAQKARDQTNAEKFEKEKMKYLLERYLWELINNKAMQKDEELTDEDRKNLFWTYYHELIDTQ